MQSHQRAGIPVMGHVGLRPQAVLTDGAFKAKGRTEEERQRVIAEAQAFEAMYRNPLVRMPMTFVEIFPVGVLVSLVSALALRRPRAAR